MANNVTADYSYLDKAYQETEAGGGYTPFPEGDYDATVDTLGVEGTKAGSDALVWDFVVTDGPLAGRHIRSWQGIPCPADMNETKTEYQLKSLKDSISKLAPLCGLSYFLSKMTKYALDKRVTITVKNRKNGGDYQNIYIKSVEEPLPATAEEAEALKKSARAARPAAKPSEEAFDPFADD